MKLQATRLRCRIHISYLCYLLLYQVVIVCIFELALSIWRRNSNDLPVLPTEILTDTDNFGSYVRKASRYWGKFDHELLLEERSICQHVTTVDILFLVHSYIKHVSNRQAIRSTFANGTNYRNHVVKVIFILGSWSNHSSQARDSLNLEHQMFRDIIQGDFDDSSGDITPKELMSLKWLSSNCKNVKYVIRIDDDVYVDPFNFIDNINHLKDNDVLMCHVRKKSSGIWNEKDARDSFLPEVTVGGKTRYPWDTCSRYAVVMSGHFIPRLYKAGLIVPFLWTDDVFHFGKLTSVIGGLRFVNMADGQFSSTDVNDATQCFKSVDCEIMATRLNPSYVYEIWRGRFLGPVLQRSRKVTIL